jgi:hypothetical protein
VALAARSNIAEVKVLLHDRDAALPAAWLASVMLAEMRSVAMSAPRVRRMDCVAQREWVAA